MASRGAGGEQILRRRPVRPESEDAGPEIDKEVEITEIEEDEEGAKPQEGKGEELEDDPMVVKGSRPTGPPQETLDGEEDDWGVDDDDNWGGKTDQSDPGKETQAQRRRRILRRSNTEVTIAFLVHLAVMGFYIYVHVYDGTVYKRNKGKGFEGSEIFGGRWKYLTYINLWLQLGYFFLAFLCDIMPRSYAKVTLAKFCDFIFTSLVFPLSIFVVLSFWGIYAIDRELIYPVRLDEHLPQILNHYWHTTIAVGVFLEMFLVFHRYPTTGNAVAIIFLITTAYIIWIVCILTVANIWVYPFLKYMPPPAISVFFAFCFFLVLGIYFLGKRLAYWRWKDRHEVMEEKK